MAICSVQYHYDPLDRLATSTQASELPWRRFYQNQRLVTEVHVDGSNSVFQHADQLLAQRINASTQLLATDFQRSVLSADQHTRQCYSPYGQRSIFSGTGSLLGFNGERPDPLTGHYLLGNGYRAYNPVLMRFNSPDSVSPFGEGGINAYAYCSDDPLNREDSTGRSWIRNIIKFLDYIGWDRVPNRVQAQAQAQAQVQVPAPTIGSTALDARFIFRDRPHRFPNPVSSEPLVTGGPPPIAPSSSASFVSSPQGLSATSESLESGSSSFSGSTSSLDSNSSWSSSASSEQAVSTTSVLRVTGRYSGLSGVSFIRGT